MNLIKLSTAVALGASLLSGGTQAFANGSTSPLCYTDTIPFATTNWNSSVSVPQFDPGIGLLRGVRFELTGSISGSARVESLDASPTVVTTTYQADITLTRPDMSVLVVATPLEEFIDNLDVHDGLIDFGGSSGSSHDNLNVQATEVVTTISPADLAIFSGMGMITLPVDATGLSTASGSGNLITQFLTSAEASVKVCYFYEQDCNSNGIADQIDVIPGGVSNDNNLNGVPDECEPGIRTFCEGSGAKSSGGANCPCGNNGNPGEGCANDGNGQGGLLTGSGIPSVSNDTLSLTASQIPNGAPGFFWFARTTPGVSQTGTGVPFGMGLRCISSPILVRKLDNGGTIPLAGAPSISAAMMISAGETTYFQYWYRNNTGPCGPGNGTTNATNGLEVIWGL
jgi:hypothetical protein